VYAYSTVNASEYYLQHANNEWRVYPTAPSYYVAHAVYEGSMNATGWATLDVQTTKGVDDSSQAYGAGYLEGYITQSLIWDWWVNTIACDGPTPPLVYEFINKNDAWLQSQISACADYGTCEYWNQVSLMMMQLDGLTDGYNNATTPNKRLTRLQLLGRSAFDEWDDILSSYNTTEGLRDPESSLLKEHCSVMVKLTDDLQNIFSSHVTWGSFCHMLRIFKHYTLNFRASPSTVSFSSFPGVLISGDDYYVNDKGLTVTETTNDIFNMSLFTYVTPATVPFWIRVGIATRVAASGPAWVDVFSKYNSGTYNNQWQVVDMKLFIPGQPLVPNTLWIAEQIPGYVISADVTSELQLNGYFPSYNIPYFEFVYNISGFPEQLAKYGDAYSYKHCPRANIFRRAQAKVKTLDDYKNIMRYNDYKNDPFSLGDACNGISARCDLNPPNKGLTYRAFGGYDCKVTSNWLMKSMTTHALSGPSSETLPPFTWRDWSSVSHVGQPDLFNFPFVAMSPTTSQ
jgi:hypothetical protein